MSASEDLWQVQVAPDEVKALTLEQVDDLYRLDLIDENTLLRQDGTNEWLPLRVVAGLDDDEGGSEPLSAPAPAPPPPPAAQPPRSTLPGPPPARSAPPPIGSAPPPIRNAPPPIGSAPPPPPPPRPNIDDGPLTGGTLIIGNAAPTQSAPPPVGSAPPPPPPIGSAPPPMRSAPAPIGSAPPPPPPPRPNIDDGPVTGATMPFGLPVRSAPPQIGSAPPPMRSAPPPIGSAPPPMRNAPPPIGSAPPPPPPPRPNIDDGPVTGATMPFGLPVRSAPAPIGSAPPPMRSAPPPIGSAPPPPPPPRPNLIEPSSSASPSFAPAVIPSRPLPPVRANRAEPALIAAAAVVGLLITLQRTGATHALFAAVGQESAYVSLEAALGGPGFGTPRAVDVLVRKTPPH